MMTFAAAKKDARYISVSDGNKKLVPTDDVKFIIFNIPAVITCPFATDACVKACYAKRAETAYPNTKKQRARNLAASQSETFVDHMIFTIAANLNRPSYKAAKKIVVRIHESGDFYRPEYFAKWLEIAAAFKDDKRVVFMGYTKSVEYVHDVPDNMVIRFSLWDDTDPVQYEIAKSKNLPVYTAVEKFTTEPKEERCRCSSCATCGKCWAALAMIKCEIH